MEIRAVSPEMSFARYLQKLCGVYNFGILIDETIAAEIRGFNKMKHIRKIGKIGFSYEESCDRTIYEAFGGQKKDIVMLKELTKKDFESGVEFFQQGKYSEAKESFINVLKKNKDDLAAGRYLRLCSDNMDGSKKGMKTFEQC